MRIAKRVFLANNCNKTFNQIRRQGHFICSKAMGGTRGAAARTRRSLMASPRPLKGMGSTAITALPEPSRRFMIIKEIGSGFAQVADLAEVEA